MTSANITLSHLASDLPVGVNGDDISAIGAQYHVRTFTL
jgi:hypothetical protein